MKAFVLTIRHSGLRIGNTIALKRERVKGNKLFLYTQKTGTPVHVPLPPAAVAALEKLNGDTEHFFTSGKAKPQTARANWSRYLDTVTVYDCSGLKSRLIAEGLESPPLKVYDRKVWAAV